MEIENDHPKSILIIDDEKSIRDVLVTFFEEKGYNVLTANDGRGGITQFQHHPTDLVITDIVMPRIEGIATIREIRKQSKSVKIIAMTGYVDSYLKEAIILGADDSIVKPFNTEDLMAVVDRVMGSEA
ncbi:MAG: response regulator [Candidatus Marinimicrobia bacterium]|nr:response regulator [Candidatus Neomarinimicrobiota bacterium]MBT3631136.1 response regulator [Candidatus Neomarinimicrobiota bacterium]MBT3823502.1 response regulator [Candidatus Neomarinimicrobiota bacterium]MBT4130392.1 response regulator [Candidatus Neomarinimicrobiota bacterium]MBT4295110.1 response regulator [Candidatus Neomarinimicrobiota bacterium]